jgi:ornithine cyclodeaminase/alanine dehydrogenase-like protein (mu-crystallin family)
MAEQAASKEQGAEVTVTKRPCPPAVRQGRLRKSEQFPDAADVVLDLADGQVDVADAYVTLCVHAGIAASDVVCCARLAEHAQGDNHTEAIALLRTADMEPPST